MAWRPVVVGDALTQLACWGGADEGIPEHVPGLVRWFVVVRSTRSSSRDDDAGGMASW